MFSTPGLIVWDTLRIIAAVGGLAVVGMTPFALAKPRMTWDQRIRFIGSAMLGAAVIGAYLYQLGTYPEQWWRTILVVLGIVFGAIGLAHFLHRYREAARGPSRHSRR